MPIGFDSYLSPRLAGLPIQSKGGQAVFANEPISPGETLVVWGGRILAWQELQSLDPLGRQLVLQVDENAYLLTLEEGPADWVNHSCEPNAGLHGQIVLKAIRAIAPGEEVCFDYAMSDGSPYDEFDCRCGTRLCRGRIAGTDWLRPELRERYRGYFSPYLQRRIDALETTTLVPESPPPCTGAVSPNEVRTV